MNENVGLIGFISLKMLIEEVIGKRVDLVEYNTIRKELKEIILKEEIPILRRQEIKKSMHHRTLKGAV